MRNRSVRTKRLAVAGALCILTGAGLLTYHQDGAKGANLASNLIEDALSAPSSGQSFRLVDEAGPGTPKAPNRALQGSPEARLIAIYRLIAEQRIDEALEAADALRLQFPTFKLASLTYADLLVARWGGLSTLGGGAATQTPSTQAELAILKDEARQRIKALQERPPAGAVPDEFVQLPSSTRYAIAVDTSRSRLYLFENTSTGLHLVSDYYISVGKQGVDKLVEGDQRTPLGVYFITDRLDPRTLEDRFGAGALPLNYPNAYDKSKGRTGSGILVHGVPSNTYSRPPLDSDGCIAMANEDLSRLSDQLPRRDTPVVITRQIRWVSNRSPLEGRQAFLDKVRQWQEARLKADQKTLEDLYVRQPAPLLPDPRFKQRLVTPAAGIDNVSVLTWHDERDTMVVTFRELANAFKAREKDRVVRQYWSRDRGDWRIVAEGPVR